MLNYAKNIFKKFNTPFLSLDICSSGKKYFIIEYQAIHFGINVFIKSQGFFKEIDGTWKFMESNKQIEEEIAYGLSNFIEKEIR